MQAYKIVRNATEYTQKKFFLVISCKIFYDIEGKPPTIAITKEGIYMSTLATNLIGTATTTVTVANIAAIELRLRFIEILILDLDKIIQFG